MFWDGFSGHKSQVTNDFAARDDIDIALIINIRYRPDLDPVEKIFRRAKHDYAKYLEQQKALNHQWDNEEVVRYVMDMIPKEFIQKEAAKLFELID